MSNVSRFCAVRGFRKGMDEDEPSDEAQRLEADPEAAKPAENARKDGETVSRPPGTDV
jgi:hypothetical protein